MGLKVSVIVGLFCAVTAGAQQEQKVTGTWKLVSYWTTRPNGERVAPYGEHPLGFLTYTADHRVFVILSRGGRKPLEGDRFTASEAERADAFSTALAYAGRFTFDGAKAVHHIEIATLPNYVGTDQVRFAKLAGNRLTLSATLTMGGEQRKSQLVWERIK